jgi:NAD(P)-dependent dehydrogenase (short-subunit alcohol dehydrogenase family)
MRNFDTIFNLQDRNIVITGSSGTLGTQFSHILSSVGANVILVDIDTKNNKKLEQIIKKKYKTNPKSYTLDLTNTKKVVSTCKKIIKDFRKIDGLINNAAFTSKVGISQSTKNYSLPFEKFPLDLWEKTLSVNLTGIFLCCQEFGKIMKKQKHGSIVNISSIYGIVGADQSIYGKSKLSLPISYASSKGAIIAMTMYLASYWRNQNIRINSLTLGGVKDTVYQKKEFIKNYSKKTMLGRMAKKDEYDGAILFLISDASSYMTGSNLIVDGGWTAW